MDLPQEKLSNIPRRFLKKLYGLSIFHKCKKFFTRGYVKD